MSSIPHTTENKMRFLILPKIIQKNSKLEICFSNVMQAS